MIRTQIQLQNEQIEWLKKFALENNISMSQVIRDCIEAYRVHFERNRELTVKKKKALLAVGSFATEDRD
ncbi:CopG family transcriptional regulator [Desulfobacter sp. UBA2225]|uniref:ribbon-helix-helix domain-containing protein n=1 Tax=Desulfobacter sp. UBA2225 TaxID=1961413 RepID=UPI0025805329|nr:CopG family transcriptional regulator [Desulfobacter sp. UBA2225]